MKHVRELAIEQEKNKASPKWEKPIPFEEPELPSFEPNVFPDWLRNYVIEVAESTQTPIDVACIAGISVLSTVLSKKGYVKITDDWIEPLNIYAILALPPGNRKSIVFKLLLKPIEEYEQEVYESLLPQIKQQQTILKSKKNRLEKLNYEYAKTGDENLLKEIELLSREIDNEKIIVPPRFFTNDVTVEKLGILLATHNEKMAILSAEGAGVLNNIAGRYDKNNTNSNMNLYLEAHTGDSVAIDRVGRETIYLREPCLTIGLFVQPEILKKLPTVFYERGLMQRFLYSFPKSFVGYRKISPNPINHATKNKYYHNIKQLIKFEPHKPLVFTLSREAAHLEVLNRTEIEVMLQEDGELGNIKEWGAKLAGQLIRITGLIHFAKQVGQLEKINTEISKDTFKSIYLLRNYFISHAKKAYEKMDSIEENDQDAKYILNRIIEKFNDKEIIEHQKLWQLVKRKFKKVQYLDQILCELENRNYLINEKVGRKKIIRINPLFIKDKTKYP